MGAGLLLQRNPCVPDIGMTTAARGVRRTWELVGNDHANPQRACAARRFSATPVSPMLS